MARLDRDLITRAALDLIDDPARPEVTLAAVARRLGVTQPALYHHVGGRKDVLRWVGIAVRHELAEWLSDCAIGVSGLDAVRAVALGWRSYSRRWPGRYRSTQWHPVEGDPDLEVAVAGVTAILASTLRAFDMTLADRQSAALALRSLLHGFATFELDAGNTSAFEHDFDRVVGLLINGIEATAAAAAALEV